MNANKPQKAEFTNDRRITFFCIATGMLIVAYFGFTTDMFLKASRHGIHFKNLMLANIFASSFVLFSISLFMVATIVPYPYSEKNKGLLEKLRDAISFIGIVLFLITPFIDLLLSF